MQSVGVVLAGCGVYDGSEIHEAVLTMLYLSQAGVDIQFFAPDMEQMHVVDHNRQQPICNQTRNVLVESARIARGAVTPLAQLDVSKLDALIFPGGFGAAKNLCTFAAAGLDSVVHPEVARVMQEAHAQHKVIGAICIAPVLLAQVFKDSAVRPRITIGNDAGVNQILTAWQAEPVDAMVSEVIIDEKNRFVTTPAYMLGQSISEIAVGIEKLVKAVLQLAR